MKLTCIGKNKEEREFSLRIFKNYFGDKEFRVTHESLKPDCFELVLRPLPDGSYFVMYIDANTVYRGHGIPDMLLPFAAKYLSTKIRSSQKMAQDGNTWRTEEATKMWDRLVSAGIAVYNREEDVYRVI
jgi:hypothetical protein